MAKILIFEDDKMLGQMYATKFRMAGFDVTYYESPEKDPLPTILREKPDIISTGIIMPNLDGFTLTQILKRDTRTEMIPVLGLDNLGQDIDIQKAHDVGMVDYLIMAKHMPSEIVERVCEILHLPKPVFDKLPTPSPAVPASTKRPWWKWLFSK